MPASPISLPACSSENSLRNYLRGRFSVIPRRNGSPVAETVGDAIPDRIQQHLYRA
jgi:hypothetical protein